MQATARRQMLAGVPAATAARGLPASAAGAPDPAIAAVERHRRAVQAWQASFGGQTRDDDKVSDLLLAAERDAHLAWLTTAPTTLAGAIATLDHASQRPYASPDDYVHTNLPGDVLEAGERFPAMITALLRQISN